MNRKSQNQQVLAHMKYYGSITSMEAFRRYAITRLSGRIFDLRERKHKIKSELVKRGCAHYAKYSLST